MMPTSDKRYRKNNKSSKILRLSATRRKRRLPETLLLANERKRRLKEEAKAEKEYASDELTIVDTVTYQGPKAAASSSSTNKAPPPKKARLTDPNEPSTSGVLQTDPLKAGPSTSTVYIKSEQLDEDESMSQDDPAMEFTSAEPAQGILPFSEVLLVKEEPMDGEFAVKTEEVNIFDDHFAINRVESLVTVEESILPTILPIPNPAPASKDGPSPHESVAKIPNFEITLLHQRVPEQILPTSYVLPTQTPNTSDFVTDIPKAIVPERSFANSQGTQTQKPPEKSIPLTIPLKSNIFQAPLLNAQTPEMPAPVETTSCPVFPEKSLFEAPPTVSVTPVAIKIPQNPSLEKTVLRSQTAEKPLPKKNYTNKKKGPDEYDQFGSFVAISLKSIKQKKYKDKLMRIIRNAIKGVCQEDLSTYTPETHLFKD